MDSGASAGVCECAAEHIQTNPEEEGCEPGKPFVYKIDMSS